MLGITLAIAASTLLNVGKGIQKWKVAVLGLRWGALARPHRRDLGLWAAGVAMTMGATVLYSFALSSTDRPSTVSALNGVGLIGLVVFAGVVLGERVGWREALGAALVIGGTTLMGMAAPPSGETGSPSIGGLVTATAVVVGAYLPLSAAAWWSRRGHGLVFGSAAGALIGMAMVMGDVALAEAGNDVLAQFRGPWVYAALVTGTLALGVTQLAFWRAPAMVVVPTTNSFVILTPAALEYFVFDTSLQPLQWVALGIIVAGVIRLTVGVGVAA